MNLTPALTEEILTGLENGSLKQGAEPPAREDEGYQDMVNEIAKLVDEHGPGVVIALAEHVKDSSEDVQPHELEAFVQERYRGSGGRVGDVLMEYAQSSEVGELHEMFEALDKAGAVDWFEWDKYAKSGPSSVNGLHFYVIPVTGVGADSVFLFEEV